MTSDSDGDDAGFTRVQAKPGKKRKIVSESGSEHGVGGVQAQADKYENFLKTGYKRNYPDNSLNTEFPVFVEGQSREDRIGNKNPLTLSKIFKSVKGIHEQRRINANKIMLVFKQSAAANNFLGNKCLEENELRAYIPASSVECVGVVRFIPNEPSNEELYNKLSSDHEIVAVRRFKKKVGEEIVALNTISVTFVGTTLPQFIYLDNWRYRVYQYVPPVMQCFRCMKFNHAAKICRNEQVCSRCSGEHNYKECTAELLKCINCGGAHLAISKDCPFKQTKIENSKRTYANVISVDNKNFPALVPRSPAPAAASVAVPKVTSVDVTRPSRANTPVHKTSAVPTSPSSKIGDLLNDERFIDIIVKTLVSLGNSNSVKTVSHIREAFLKNCKI